MKKLLFILFIASFLQSGYAQIKSKFLEGVVFFNQGKYPDAINSFSASIENNDHTERSYFLRGKAYLLNDEYEKSVSDFRKSDDSISFLWISKAYAGMDDVKNALANLKVYLQFSKKTGRKSITGDDAFNKIQYTDEWFDFWQNEWYTEIEKSIDAVSNLIFKNELNTALDKIHSLMEEVPDNKELYFKRAQIFYAQGNYKGALSDINLSISKDKNNLDYYNLRTKIYAKTEKFDKALVDVNLIIKARPEEINLYKERAELYLDMKDYLHATKDIDLYLSLFESDAEGLLISGEIHFEKEEYLEALKNFNKLLEQDQSKAEYFKLRGMTYLETSTYKYAVDDFAMALDLDPEDGKTYLYKGLARYKSGDAEGACIDWNRAKFYGEMQAIEYLLNYCQ